MSPRFSDHNSEKKRTKLKNKTSSEKFRKLCIFGLFEAEKIEFEVSRSNFKNLENDKFSIFLGVDIFILRQSKNIFFSSVSCPQYHLTRGKKILNVSKVKYPPKKEN